MDSRPISQMAGERPHKATIGSRTERLTGHTGTQTRPQLLRGADGGGRKAWDCLVANSGNGGNRGVDFFGGEPLMNWQVVKDLVAYGREQEKRCNKRLRFTLTTNGVLLNDEVQEFVNREIVTVDLSSDRRW